MRQRQTDEVGAEARTIDLLTDVATRFYLRGDSQIDIARDLGLDPSTVSRHLKRARHEGIIHVEIRPPRREALDLGLELAGRYRLDRAIVAPAGPDPEDALGAVAAEYVEGIMRSGTRLGISWGRTLAALVRHLHPGTVAGVSVTQLAGGIDDPRPGIQGADLVRRVAELYPDSTVRYLHAPAIVASEAIHEALLSDPTIQAALEAARQTEIALVGIGQLTTAATLYLGGHVPSDDWRELVEAGAVGNMNTRFFDADGRPTPELERRTMAITWEDMRSIPTVVAVAAGLDKVAAIGGALATKAIDTLVTDQETATALLEHVHGHAAA